MESNVKTCAIVRQIKFVTQYVGVFAIQGLLGLDAHKVSDNSFGKINLAQEKCWKSLKIVYLFNCTSSQFFSLKSRGFLLFQDMVIF